MNPYDTFEAAKSIAHIITWFGDPILRINCEEIDVQEIQSKWVQELANRLVYSLKEIQLMIGLGRGLAAPQIGESKRMFVIFYEDEYKVFINPKITKSYKEQNVYPEMCLSGLPLAASVIRPSKVDLEYYDSNGVLNRITANSMFARLIQHELDHLDGILFIDKAELSTVQIVSEFEKFKKAAMLIELEKKGENNV